MSNIDLVSKVMEKKELSDLPLADVRLAFSHFERRQTSDEEKVRLTRELLHKAFGSFGGSKLVSMKKKKDADWILKKHISTRERLDHYSEVYGKIFKGLKKTSVIDLGCGVNGLSFLNPMHRKLVHSYTGLEAVGQIASLADKEINGTGLGRVFHGSLFDLDKVLEISKKEKKPRVVFLFKVLDSLEILERDYSKRLIEELVPLAERIVVSFATASFHKRQRFGAKRTWITEFLETRFKIIDDFEIGQERYLVFRKKIK